MLKISRQNPIPLYLQLEEVVRSQIAAGVLQPGDPLPTEVDLQVQYGVSRTTVRQAMANLERDGIIYRLQGKGTFISKPQKTQPQLSILSSFSEEILRDGRVPGARVLRLAEIPSPLDVAGHLDVDEGCPLIFYERIRTIDDRPVGIHTAYLNKQVIPNLPFDRLRSDDISLYKVLEEECGIRIGTADEVLEAITADESIARILDVPIGFPVMSIERTTATVNETPFEYCKIFVRGDEFRYRARLYRQEEGELSGGLLHRS